jgi:hypothetical protein
MNQEHITITESPDNSPLQLLLEATWISLECQKFLKELESELTVKEQILKYSNHNAVQDAATGEC